MDVMTPAMERTLERLEKKWHDMEEGGPGRKALPLKVITVSRQPGSGGKLVAARVAMRTGLRYVDREIVQEIAGRAKTDPGAVERHDEKSVGLFEGWMEALTTQHRMGPASLLRHLHIGVEEYFHHLSELVADLANTGAVIVGRGANFILPRESCFRVRVVAPMDLRVENMARMADITRARARVMIMQRESDRRKFARRLFRKDLADARHYDLVVNTGPAGLRGAVDNVVRAWENVNQAAEELGPDR